MILSSISIQHRNTGECVRVFAKGVILGQGVCARLGLKEGDCIGVLCDSERKGDLYLCAVAPVKGYPIHKRGKQYHLHSRELARLILSEANVVDKDFALFRVGEPVEYNGGIVLPIITKINYANY